MQEDILLPDRGEDRASIDPFQAGRLRRDERRVLEVGPVAVV